MACGARSRLNASSTSNELRRFGPCRFTVPTYILLRFTLDSGRLYSSRPLVSGRRLSRARIMAIIIEFFGGYHDGGQLSSDSRDEQEATLSRRLYFRATREGTIGKQIQNRYRCLTIDDALGVSDLSGPVICFL
jgi:hypothetical protein